MFFFLPFLRGNMIMVLWLYLFFKKKTSPYLVKIYWNIYRWNKIGCLWLVSKLHWGREWETAAKARLLWANNHWSWVMGTKGVIYTLLFGYIFEFGAKFYRCTEQKRIFPLLSIKLQVWHFQMRTEHLKTVRKPTRLPIHQPQQWNNLKAHLGCKVYKDLKYASQCKSGQYNYSERGKTHPLQATQMERGQILSSLSWKPSLSTFWACVMGAGVMRVTFHRQLFLVKLKGKLHTGRADKLFHGQPGIIRKVN